MKAPNTKIDATKAGEAVAAATARAQSLEKAAQSAKELARLAKARYKSARRAFKLAKKAAKKAKRTAAQAQEDLERCLQAVARAKARKTRPARKATVKKPPPTAAGQRSTTSRSRLMDEPLVMDFPVAAPIVDPTPVAPAPPEPAADLPGTMPPTE